MILLSLVVHTVKLSKGRLVTRHLAVTEEAPELAQGHGERFFALCSFDLTRITGVPALQVTVVTEHDVLDLFFYLGRVLLILC